MGMVPEITEQAFVNEKNKKGKFKHSAEKKNKPRPFQSVLDLFYEVERINERLNGRPKDNFSSVLARKVQNRLTTCAILTIRAKKQLIDFVTEYDPPNKEDRKQNKQLRIMKSPNYSITVTAKNKCRIGRKAARTRSKASS